MSSIIQPGFGALAYSTPAKSREAKQTNISHGSVLMDYHSARLKNQALCGTDRISLGDNGVEKIVDFLFIIKGFVYISGHFLQNIGRNHNIIAAHALARFFTQQFYCRKGVVYERHD